MDLVVVAAYFWPAVILVDTGCSRMVDFGSKLADFDYMTVDFDYMTVDFDHIEADIGYTPVDFSLVDFC